jgi:hypothetical protein
MLQSTEYFNTSYPTNSFQVAAYMYIYSTFFELAKIYIFYFLSFYVVYVVKPPQKGMSPSCQEPLTKCITLYKNET